MLWITTLLVNVAPSTARMPTGRAHARPCLVQTKPAGTMADGTTEKVHRLARKSPYSGHAPEKRMR